jgi:hypothetical protein
MQMVTQLHVGGHWSMHLKNKAMQKRIKLPITDDTIARVKAIAA